MSKKPTKGDLEEAYAKVDEIEKKIIKRGVEGRLLLFAEIQATLNDRAIPKFDRGTTMSQAYRMGMDTGVEITLASFDQQCTTITDADDRLINIGTTEHGIDIIPMADLWVNYINN